MDLLDDQRDLDPILFLALNERLERAGKQGVDRRPSVRELEIPNESGEDDLVLEERCVSRCQELGTRREGNCERTKTITDADPGAFEETEYPTETLCESVRCGELGGVEPSLWCESFGVWSPNLQTVGSVKA